MVTNVRVNNFLQQTERRFVDPLSKFYIGFETILGLNRLPIVLTKGIYSYILISLFAVYSMILVVGLYYDTTILARYRSVVINGSEYIFCVIFSLISWKRMQKYYDELNKFDIAIGCRPKQTNQSSKNCIVMAVFSIFFISLYCLSHLWDYFGRKDLDPQLIPVFFLHIFELCYHGHLLSLIECRLRLINFFVTLGLYSGKCTTRKWPDIEKHKSFKNVKKNIEMTWIMDLYLITIKAHDFLVEAIKWQLLVILITTFTSTLDFCHLATTVFFRKEHPLPDILWGIIMMMTEMLPLFSPCIFSDRVHGQVRRLRQLLGSRLYENKLDKSDRCAARALLALTNARDLSFSLLQVFKVDVSLPFKFIGLLFTYLIITLQFHTSSPST